MAKQYTGEFTREISFPLGGIGSGCIGLAGNGSLMEFEVLGKPNKRSRNGYTHFAVKAEDESGLIDARVLQGDIQPGFTGEHVRGGSLHSGYGFGPNPQTMAGLTHFETCEFDGEFPIARVHFEDERFPGAVKMTAFNPFIPLNDHDSSIPAAFFEIELTNPRSTSIDYTVALSLGNPVPGDNLHTVETGDDVCALVLSQHDAPPLDPRKRGQMCIATDAPCVSYQQYWYRGGWNDGREMFLRDLRSPGRFQNRTYPAHGAGHALQDSATLAAHARIEPGESAKLRFVISWFYPNMSNDWSPEKDEGGKPVYRYWKHYYASLFEDAAGVARYALERFDSLYRDTDMFRDALYSSSLPESAMEAVGANLSVLKSPVCYRLENGEFYAFEGALEAAGSCEGSCTHVWNYAYALPFLFPKLERSMRDLEYGFCMGEHGDVTFRMMLPLGRERWGFRRPCVDGQFGGIIKCYRDWKISGDSDWLKGHWPDLKRALQYAWSENNPDRWDPERSGLITGRQHHTLDMELFGANSWLSGFYLTALKAAIEMARFFGDDEAETEYVKLFEKGKSRLNAELFDGDHYVQHVDLGDRSLLAGFEGAEDDYWNDEAKEIKYQIATGRSIDQMLAQWHANLCGLGEVFDAEQVKVALGDLYAHNFKRMRDVDNTWRLFSLQDEEGLLICTWPEDYKPAVPLTYASETMTGFEYAAACHMIQEGLVTEGMRVVEAIRARYDGKRRNPWNEMECGSNYARSMASYSLLLTFSGFEYDASAGYMGFFPLETEEETRFFWSLGDAWGLVEISPDCVRLDVLYGELRLNSFGCSAFEMCDVEVDGVICEKLNVSSVVLSRVLKRGEAVDFIIFY